MVGMASEARMRGVPSNPVKTPGFVVAIDERADTLLIMSAAIPILVMV